MFTRAFSSAFALIALSALAIYWFAIQIRPEDMPAYEKLLQESAELHAHQILEEQPAYQKREGVQKDIWTQKETRHLQIQSGYSELLLFPKKDKVEAIEKLKEISCCLENGMLTADRGIYTFPAHQFIAQDHCRLTQNQNEITSQRIEFNFAEETITFEEPEGYLAKGPLRFTARSLTWDKKEGKLTLDDQVTLIQPDQFHLEANRGLLTLHQFEPKELILKGDVRLLSSRLQGKESYALADTLTYDPLTQTLLFSAAKRVLFWQEGLSLSALEVLIRADQTIEGHGDVHFAFDLEERDLIENLFKPYL